MSRDYVSLRQEAHRLKIAEIRIWQLIRQGIIPSAIVVGQVALPREQWEKYLAEHPEQLAEWQQAMADLHSSSFIRPIKTHSPFYEK
jgi:hypothetical protein